MTATVAAAETETGAVEASPATKHRGNAEATIAVEIATETAIVVAIATEIVAVIGMVIETETVVVILAPETESKRHRRSVLDWLWLQGANPKRMKREIQLLLQVSLVGLSLSTQCRRRRRWMRSLPRRRRRRREQERRQEKLRNPIPLARPNQSTL